MSIINLFPSLHILSFPELGQESALFGYRYLYLPDFSADHTLLEQTLNEKLAEVLRRFERFVIGQRKYRLKRAFYQPPAVQL